MTTNAVARGADPSIGKSFRLRTLAVLALSSVAIFARPAHGQTADLAAVNREAFLSAVAEVETGGNARAIGRHGERGLYQFTRATWRRFSTRSFADAHNPAVAHDVAVRHFNWLRERLVANGQEPTMNRMAVAWNAGINRALSGSAPRSTRDYARRVSNLAGMPHPAVRKPAAARPALVATARTPRPAPAVVAAPAPVSFARIEKTAPEVIQISFALDGPSSVAPSDVSPETADAESDEITFTLATPATRATGTGASSVATPPRRLIFATIGE